MLILFTFTCEHCDHVFEELVKRGTQEHSCPKCDEIASKTIVPVKFDCGKGLDPDFPTAYDQWAKKRHNRYKTVESYKREHGEKPNY